MDVMAVKIGRNYLLLRTSEIEWLQSDGNYVRVYQGSRFFLKRGTLVGMEKKLDPRQFIRVNRSVIINVDQIKELRTAKNRYEVVLHNGKTWSWSRRFRHNMSNIINF